MLRAAAECREASAPSPGAPTPQPAWMVGASRCSVPFGFFHQHRTGNDPRAKARSGKGERRSRAMPKQLTIDPEIWKRNLRNAPLTDDDACTRWFNNYFAFWVICETKACQRAKRCAGDANVCCDRMMP